MKILIDTSVIVDIDQGKEKTAGLMKKLVEDERFELFASTVTVTEVLAGAYRNGEPKQAKNILGQFQWIEVNGKIADYAAQTIATLLDEGRPIEFQDVLISATARQINAEKILTQKTEHFQRTDPEAHITKPLELKKEIDQ